MPGDEFRSIDNLFQADIRQVMDDRSVEEHHARIAHYACMMACQSQSLHSTRWLGISTFMLGRSTVFIWLRSTRH